MRYVPLSVPPMSRFRFPEIIKTYAAATPGVAEAPPSCHAVMSWSPWSSLSPPLSSAEAVVGFGGQTSDQVARCGVDRPDVPASLREVAPMDY